MFIIPNNTLKDKYFQICDIGDVVANIMTSTRYPVPIY